MNINAVFEDDYIITTGMYPLAYTSQGGRNVSVSSVSGGVSIYFDKGTSTKKMYNNFLAWADGNTKEILSTDNPYVFTPTGDMYIVALTGDENYQLIASNSTGMSSTTITITYIDNKTQSFKAYPGGTSNQPSYLIKSITASSSYRLRLNLSTLKPGNTWNLLTCTAPLSYAGSQNSSMRDNNPVNLNKGFKFTSEYIGYGGDEIPVYFRYCLHGSDYLTDYSASFSTNKINATYNTSDSYYNMISGEPDNSTLISSKISNAFRTGGGYNITKTLQY
jgi:hypothetical protein